MAHRVIHSNSYSSEVSGATEQAIKDIKDEIVVQLSGYSTHFAECNDGTNEEGRYTIGVNADFNSSTDANEFNAWLKQKYTDNNILFDYVRTRVHDCMHAADENQPCMIGDVWTM
jgi:hypothetical protein